MTDIWFKSLHAAAVWNWRGFYYHAVVLCKYTHSIHCNCFLYVFFIFSHISLFSNAWLVLLLTLLPMRYPPTTKGMRWEWGIEVRPVTSSTGQGALFRQCSPSIGWRDASTLFSLPIGCCWGGWVYKSKRSDVCKSF